MSPLLASYVVQAAGALFTAVLFGFFSRTYRKPFLVHWGRAWASMCIMLFGAGLTIALSNANISSPTAFARLTVSLFTSVAAYVSVAWMIFGATELVSSDWANAYRKHRGSIFAAATVVGIVLTLLFANNPDPFGPRFTVRVAIRSGIIGVAFVLAAIS